VCRSDCGRLGEPPGLNLSRRDTGIDAARVVSRRGFEVGIVMVVAGRHAGRAAPPILALVRGCRSTHRHIISGALSIDSGRHPQLLPAHNRSNPSSSPLRPPPRVGVFVLVSRRCVRTSQTPCSRYHPPHGTPLKIKPFNGDSPNASHPQPCSGPQSRSN
jgi:hypothetical protein